MLKTENVPKLMLIIVTLVLFLALCKFNESKEVYAELIDQDTIDDEIYLYLGY